MTKKAKKSVGIDVGSKFIKIVSLEYNEETIEIDRYIIQKTPSTLVVNGVIQFPEDLGEIIESLLKENDIKTKHASISIPVGEETALLKWVDVPDLKPKEMNKAIHSIIEDELLHSPDNLYYNWERVSEKEKNKDGSVSLILVGVIKQSMDNHIKFLKKTKIKPYFAEADIFSHVRSLINPKSFLQKDQNKMIIDIGSNGIIMGFIQEGKFAYMRNIPTGTNGLVDKISLGMSIGSKEAEEELIKNGVISEEIYTLPFDSQPVAEILLPAVDVLVDGIMDTLYFYKDFSGGEVDEIILTGGGSSIEGISQFIESRLGIRTRIGQPYFIKKDEHDEEEFVKKTGDFFEEEVVTEKPKTPLEKDLPILNIAIGLALKEVLDNV